jgi:hypothetical protein
MLAGWHGWRGVRGSFGMAYANEAGIVTGESPKRWGSTLVSDPKSSYSLGAHFKYLTIEGAKFSLSSFPLTQLLKLFADTSILYAVLLFPIVLHTVLLPSHNAPPLVSEFQVTYRVHHRPTYLNSSSTASHRHQQQQQQ